MGKQQNTTIDMDALVTASINGEKRFAGTHRIRRLGVAGYRAWLAGKLAVETIATRQDPRRRKREARR